MRTATEILHTMYTVNAIWPNASIWVATCITTYDLVLIYYIEVLTKYLVQTIVDTYVMRYILWLL